MKDIVYNQNDRAIVTALKEAPNGLTLAELREVTGINLQPGHVTAAKNKQLIAPQGTRTVTRNTFALATVYTFVTADALGNEKGTFNYTDSEKAILAVAATMENPFTLAQLATAMGVEKLTSGNINGLVRKGNFTKAPEKIKVPAVKNDEVNVYVFVADIPEGK